MRADRTHLEPKLGTPSNSAEAGSMNISMNKRADWLVMDLASEASMVVTAQKLGCSIVGVHARQLVQSHLQSRNQCTVACMLWQDAES